MLKRYVAIILLNIACAILLGHSFIPHHHHDTKQELAEHLLTDHHHDSDDNSHDDNDSSDEDNSDLSHRLSHFIHSSDNFTIQNIHNISNTFSKQRISIVAVLPNNFFFGSYIIGPLLIKPPGRHLIYLSPHSPSTGLRGPPSFVA